MTSAQVVETSVTNNNSFHACMDALIAVRETLGISITYQQMRTTGETVGVLQHSISPGKRLFWAIFTRKST